MKLSAAILTLALICSAQFANAQLTRSTISFNENTVTFKEAVEQFEIIDPETGESAIAYKKQQMPDEKQLVPDELNGTHIHLGTEASEPVGAASQSTLQDYLRTNFLLNELDGAKGEVASMDIIITEEGKVGYIRIFFSSTDQNKIAATLKAIQDKVASKTFVPAKKDGKAVPYGIKISGL